MYENEHIPGYTAVRSATVKCNFHPTTTVLTPILPYPATTYDAVLTTMINFQDALKQKVMPTVVCGLMKVCTALRRKSSY